MESPTTAHISAAATIHPLILFDSNRHTLDQRACLSVVGESGESSDDAGRGGGSAPMSLELPETGSPDVALEPRRAGGVSWGSMPRRFMILV